jgi:hypothetical protein
MRSTNPFRSGYFFFIIENKPGEGLTACAAELFQAPDDIEAMHIANGIFKACDDAFHGYQLVRGDRIVATNLQRQPPPPMLDLQAVTTKRQANMRSIEETLFDAYQCFARSKKLLRELDRQPPREL